MAKEKGKTKREWVKIEDDPQYFEALGRFVEAFASVEVMMTLFVGTIAGMEHMIAKAVFTGLRVDAGIDTIKRIWDLRPPTKEVQQEFDDFLLQLRAINRTRNMAVHHGSFVTSDLGRISSTAGKIASAGKVKEIQVSPKIMAAMCADLDKINMHMLMQTLKPHASFKERAGEAAVLNDEWQYRRPDGAQS